MRLLAIDPGSERSALVIYDTESRRPTDHRMDENCAAVQKVYHLHSICDALVIECSRAYTLAMKGGARFFPQEVLDTARWVGWFECAWTLGSGWKAMRPQRIDRREVREHLCGGVRGIGDPQVRAALIDRYGGTRTKALGRKHARGPLYGFAGDEWAALAVAVTWAEKLAVAVPQGRDCAERSAGGTT